MDTYERLMLAELRWWFRWAYQQGLIERLYGRY